VVARLTLPEQIAIWDRRGAGPDAYPLSPDLQLSDRLRQIPAKLRLALDLGCGHGRHLCLLASLGWRIVGLDWSAVALEHAKRTVEASGRYARFIAADFRHLPFDKPVFSLIIATRALNHGFIADFRLALTEIKRVLLTGGTAIVSVPTLNNAPLTTDGVWEESGTLVLAHGIEAGIPHHFFSEDEIHTCTQEFDRVQVDRVIEPLPDGFTAPHEHHLNEWFWITLTG
jgi:SAM-dependent methyltransferase